MKLSIIAAMANHNVIGKNNTLPWHLPADLKHFKTITMGKPILMGRKTYDSIGKPLPGRQNIILTRNTNLSFPGCLVISDIKALPTELTTQEIMIIGGAEIFQQFLPQAQHLYLTFIHADINGDTYFPEWNADEWIEIAREDHLSDDNNPFSYSFIELVRVVQK